MNIENLTTIEALENFLKGNQIIAYSVLGGKVDKYLFIRKTLVKFSYISHSAPNTLRKIILKKSVNPT